MMRKKIRKYFKYIAFVTLMLFLIVIISLSIKNKQITSSQAAYKKIINGQDVREGEFPFFVTIFKKYDPYYLKYTTKKEKLIYYDLTYNLFCGGTLINSQWMVTAAHCIFDGDLRAENINKYGLATNIIMKNGTLTRAEFVNTFHDIDSFFVSPNFDPKIQNINDIALIKLKKPISNVTRYPLTNNIDKKKDFLAVGFGCTDIKQTTVTIAPDSPMAEDYQELANKELLSINAECFIKKRLRKIFLPLINMNFDGFMGAFELGYDNRAPSTGMISFGDSGGPIMQESSNKYDLVGVFSGGINLWSVTNNIGTKISNYKIWIDKVTSSKVNCSDFPLSTCNQSHRYYSNYECIVKNSKCINANQDNK